MTYNVSSQSLLVVDLPVIGRGEGDFVGLAEGGEAFGHHRIVGTLVTVETQNVLHDRMDLLGEVLVEFGGQ